MKPEPKIQILDVTWESGQETMGVIREHLSTIGEIARKHGVRSLLISPHMRGGDGYDAIFAIRMNDDSYGAGKLSAFVSEVETVVPISAKPIIHSPDNPYIQRLKLDKPYHDELGERPVVQAEIDAQSGFRRQARNDGNKLT